MIRPSFVFVLVEDQRQRQFIYRFLLKAGVGSHQMQIQLSPSGQGSAEKGVCDNFAKEAAKCRARNARASTGMIVVIDADTGSRNGRLKILDEALVAAGQTAFDPMRDPIARLVPKRNIETWIQRLSQNDTECKEELDYKPTKNSQAWSDLIPAASETFHRWFTVPSEKPAELIDSLEHAFLEIPRALTMAEQ